MAACHVDNLNQSEKTDSARTNQRMIISQAARQPGSVHEWVAALQSSKMDGVEGNHLEKEANDCNSFGDQGIKV